MKRRSTTGGKASKARRRKAESHRTPSTVVGGQDSGADDLQKQLDQRTRERDEARRQFAEALEQQTSTTEVLRLVSGAPGALQTIFETVLENAVRLCGAKFGNLWLRDGDSVRIAAIYGGPVKYRDFLRANPVVSLDSRLALSQIIRSNKVIQVPDIQNAPNHGNKMRLATIKLAGARTLLGVPMLKGDVAIGSIGIYRQEVKPFTARQIELVQNFAAQAVVAIENARLLNELRQRTDDLTESLEQQTATSEVLGVISSSPGELEPVFQTMLANATRLCEAKFGILYRCEDDKFRILALHGVPRKYAEEQLRRPAFKPPGTLGEIARTRQASHIADIKKVKAYASTGVNRLGARTLLNVPMLKDGEVVGAIAIYRQEVHPFTEKQIELVQNFAAQAVIAIENTRLLNELRQRTDDLSESLEQQTATSEVLKVISSSPGALDPVFNAMLSNATRICEAKLGTLLLCEADGFRQVALHGAPRAYVEYRRREPFFRPNPKHPVQRAAATKQVIHISDIAAAPPDERGRLADLAGARTLLVVPMLKDDKSVGVIAIYRQEVRPFTEKQIELVQNFAAQAVIAIENTRLLNELRQRTDDLTEALEQQTATSEVLKVISSSPGELEPVFESLLASAIHLCGAKFGIILLREGDAFRTVALHGATAEYTKARWRAPLIRPAPDTGLGRVLKTKRVGQILDVQAVAGYVANPVQAPIVHLAGVRSKLTVPMLKEGDLIGVIEIDRQEVRPFTDKQVELVTNFAAQAVIAIENTRLLTELRQSTDDLTESLGQQTATSEVLKVISSSPGELAPVFQAMLDNATRICGAEFGHLSLCEGDAFCNVAARHVDPAIGIYGRGEVFHPDPDAPIARAAISKQVVHVEDFRTEPAYLRRSAPAVRLVEVLGGRTVLAVPLVKDTETLGVFLLYRPEVHLFEDKHVELVKSFAAQAVIAIENARLLNELRQSLQQQTATAEVLKVISRSTFDLQTVLDALTESAALLCEADMATIARQKGDAYHYATVHKFPPELEEYLKSIPHPPGRGSIIGRTLVEGKVIHLHDVMADPEYQMAEVQKKAGFRTGLGVPLLRESVPIGVIALLRRAVQPFTEKQIELLQTFADQAVIAIENVRLFDAEQQRTRELSEALEQQTATSEVLKVISSSQGILEPVFGAILANATRICEAKFGNLNLWNGEAFRNIAVHGETAFVEQRRHGTLVEIRNYPAMPLACLAATKAIVHVPDMRTQQAYLERYPRTVELVESGGARTYLAVPMLKDEELIGAIVIYRQEVQPFTDKQIDLVKNFAAQAVIAIENARLLNELRQRTDDLSEALEQQTATSEVLGVISSSPGELEPIFSAMLENATRICGAKFGILYLAEGDGMRAVTMHDAPPAFAEGRRNQLIHPPPDTAIGQVMRTKKPVQVEDVREERSYVDRHPMVVQSIDQGGMRTVAAVPMLKDDVLVGVIVIYRQEVRPFTDKQIALVKNFAAQAVIAIENARLLNELRQRTEDLSESLEQQTATSEVLQVISSSPGDLKPVFQTMMENAARICAAEFGVLYLYDGDVYRVAAAARLPPAVAAMLQGSLRPGEGTAIGRVARTMQVEHITDLANEQIGEDDRQVRSAASEFGIRTLLAVPMIKDGSLIGAISFFRKEVKPFTDKQIALVMNFAAQAVIAIENTRLLNELRQRTDDLSESLEQQTATSEVLSVISSSAGELQPVFETMLAKAVELCEASYGGLWLRAEDGFRYVALHGDLPQVWIDSLRNGTVIRVRPETPLARVAQTRSPVQVPDMRTDPSYLAGDPLPVSGVDVGGIRTLAAVPMIKDGELVGIISIYRKEVRPLSDKQIELVTNFAAQAVIAIENTRLLNELRESLQQQTATSEVLGVISSSPGELEPVFEAILANATRICEANFGNLFLYEGDAFRIVALHSAPPAWAERWQRESVLSIRDTSEIPLARLARTNEVVHISDLRAEQSYIERDFPIVALIELAGARTYLAVPMLKENKLLGAIAIYRQEVCPFTEKQIELVKNFAAQAVIAIENTRLLDELRHRTDDLSEALDRQTAMSEVLGVISSSPSDLDPVFQVIVESVARLCEAYDVAIWRPEGGQVRLVAHHGPIAVESLPLIRETVAGRTVLDRQTLHIADLQAEVDEFPESSKNAQSWGFRSLLCVPLMREGVAIGAIALRRREIQLFSDKQFELVTNFAAQAVIAIENTRLLNELRESLAQQTATADVLKIISRSTFDLKTVLNTLVESAARLSDSDFATLNRQHADGYRQVASYGLTPDTAQTIEAKPLSAGRGSVVGRTLLERKPIQIVDVLADPDFKMADISKRTGANTILGVPLLREGEPIGVMTLQRRAKESYTDKQIELLTTFADQAVIAIENVRLFESVEARTRELAQSLEDLQTAQDRLVQTQKLASLGQLTAGIAHEIKNPLNFVNNFSSLSIELLDELQDALKRGQYDDKTRAEIDELTQTLRANLDKIEQHGKRADSIVKNMLLHSREGSGEHRPVDINNLVEESLNLAYHGARAEKQGFNITLERALDPAAGEIDLYPQEITRVLLNLISNGFYAATKRKGEAGDGAYEPTLSVATKDLGDRVEIRIRDNGTGIPPEVKDKMFNPFFTTKPAGEGTGLGLSLSHDIIVKQHGGTIEVDTEPGAFTEIKIVLPRAAAAIANTGGQT